MKTIKTVEVKNNSIFNGLLRETREFVFNEDRELVTCNEYVAIPKEKLHGLLLVMGTWLAVGTVCIMYIALAYYFKTSGFEHFTVQIYDFLKSSVM